MAKPRRIAARVALILAFLIGAVALKIVGNELTRLFGVARLYRELVSGTIALLLMIVAGLLIDRSWRDFRDQRFELLPRPVLGPRGLLSGVVIGLSMIAVVFGLAWLIGGIRVRPRSVDLVRWLGLAGFIAIATLINAAWEEYAFRGWPFAGAAKLIPAWAVATLTGVLFGLAHLFSAHAS
ncbi:MAG: CPBP family intramembrane metalloprotease, partial [Myxococcales bacterium]|nr:CPBP family intramembrane metalloprotease [Myxococcales bacterium]